MELDSESDQQVLKSSVFLSSKYVKKIFIYPSKIHIFRAKIQVVTSTNKATDLQKGFSFNGLTLHWYLFGGVLRSGLSKDHVYRM